MAARRTHQPPSFLQLCAVRRHPTQAEGDKKSIGVRSSPVVMNGRFYNPWNTDAAMKSVKEFIEVRPPSLPPSLPPKATLCALLSSIPPSPW